MGLNSSSVIRIVDLLCEGPIDGIEGSRTGIYLNDSPLRTAPDADGGEQDLVGREFVTYNFRNGSREQKYLPQATGRAGTVLQVPEGEVGQNYTETLNANKLVKTRNYGAGTKSFQVSDTDVDSVDLLFTVPALFSTAQEGLVRGQPFDAVIFFDVFVQAVGSGSGFKRVQKTKVASISEDFRPPVNNVFFIEGISTTNYQYAINGIDLKQFGRGPWNIRVRKYPDGDGKYEGNISFNRSDAEDIDQDIFRATFGEFEDTSKRTSLQNGRRNRLIWTAVVPHKNIRTAYPYSACVGMNISTEEFQSLPTRSYLVRGKKVRIPHNATVKDDGSLDFQGSFDGYLAGSAVWTTCPVCIFYDLLTNKRFGAGHFVDANNLSWVDLYPLARYCNEEVDGEPRFACNVQVSSQAEAFTVLQDFASIFRAMMYWQSNTIQLTADHGNLDGSDIDAVHVFSNSNVIDGVFTYNGSSLKARSTSIRVRYNDPENLYKPNVICIEDSELISKYGYQVKEVLAFGCTSKKQARRLGRWMMKSEELESKTVAFVVGLEGVLVFPGQVFAIQDELRARKRLSGRINSSTTTAVVADQSFALTGANPVLTCVLSDGTVESRAIDINNTSGTTVAVSSAFSAAPLVQGVYSISTDSGKEQKFRCLSVADNGDGTFAIIGVEFNDSIYSAVDEEGELEFEEVTIVDNRPPMPHI